MVKVLCEILILDVRRPMSPGRGERFKIELKKVANVELGGLLKFTKGKSEVGDKDTLHAMTCLTNFLHHQPATMYTPVGSNFFTPSNSVNIPGGLCVWRGYHQVGFIWGFIFSLLGL